MAEFERDLRGNLYKIWNRMSSGSYFPPPVRMVEILKPQGGVRVLGVPTVRDRVAQTVAAMVLERKVEPIFHPDSDGYRPRRGAIDAVGTCRMRCWTYDWVIDLDIKAFFDSVPWHLMLKAVDSVCDLPWVRLCVKRWLAAPLDKADGTLEAHSGNTSGLGGPTRPGGCGGVGRRPFARGWHGVETAPRLFAHWVGVTEPSRIW